MIHYFTLIALAKELDAALGGAVVREIFSHQKDEIILACGVSADDPYSRVLNVSIVPRFNYCVLRRDATRAKRNSVDLFDELRGSTMKHVSLVPFNRVVTIKFSNELSLVLRLFNTAESNVILVDENETVLSSFKNEKELIGTRNQTRGRAFDDRCLTDGRHFSEQMMALREETVARALRQTIPFLGPSYVKEAIFLSGIHGETPIISLDGEKLKVLFEVTCSMVKEAMNPRPVMYLADERHQLSVITLRHLGNSKSESFNLVNEAITVCVRQHFRSFGREHEKRRYLAALQGECHRSRRTLEAMDQELGEADRAEAYERLGNVIIANLHHLTKGVTHVELPDLFAGDSTLRVSMNPTLTPVQNAERYFNKSKRAKVARLQIGERRTTIDKRIALLEKMILEIERCETHEEIREFSEAYRKELTRMKLIGKTEATERPPFRVFTVEGGAEVWVGKNSANNDLLTMKHSKPNDLWFHARGASGSHTVLKCHGSHQPPGKEVIRQAAAIAAYYSKMRKASHVPVAYCERKYVRKPKGVPGGAVTLEREKVIFVNPQLPKQTHGGESDDN